MLGLGYGLTNAAYRTTKGSGDLRRGDFAGSGERFERLAKELGPQVIAFVGKSAYEGVFRERPEHGLQERRLGETRLFVLPSTSPANAAVPYEERLRWFRALRAELGALGTSGREAYLGGRPVHAAEGVGMTRLRTFAAFVVVGMTTGLIWTGVASRGAWSLCGRDGARHGCNRRHRRRMDRRLGHGPAVLRRRGPRSHARPDRTRARRDHRRDLGPDGRRGRRCLGWNVRFARLHRPRRRAGARRCARVRLLVRGDQHRGPHARRGHAACERALGLLARCVAGPGAHQASALGRSQGRGEDRRGASDRGWGPRPPQAADEHLRRCP